MLTFGRAFETDTQLGRIHDRCPSCFYTRTRFPRCYRRIITLHALLHVRAKLIPLPPTIHTRGRQKLQRLVRPVARDALARVVAAVISCVPSNG